MSDNGKPKSLNFILILMDMARNFTWAVMNLFSPEKKADLPKVDFNSGRFDVIPSNSIQDDTLKHQFSERAGDSEKASPQSSSTTRVSASNYQQLYLENIEKQKVHKPDDAKKKANNEQQAADMRFRARELQNQIFWWKSQQGQGQYDDTTITTTIDALQNELNGIPPSFWT